MSEWRNIIKAPMPIDTRDNRDEEYRQKIIQYEKEVIEPYFTQYVRTRSGGSNIGLGITFGDKANSNYFYIDDKQARELGGNTKFILSVIKKLYDDEGYQTKMSSSPNRFPSLTIEQKR